MRKFYFERLGVWQDSRNLVTAIYKVTNEFPTEEKYGMISQLKRASTSISANIAEGMSRSTDKEKAHFINIAFGSAIEVISFLVLACDLKYIDDKAYTMLREEAEKVTNKLNGLHKTLKG